jgi:hypothetical protein
MWKFAIVAVVALGIGLTIGWWLRERSAMNTCFDMGGQWQSPGLCYDANEYRFE